MNKKYPPYTPVLAFVLTFLGVTIPFSALAIGLVSLFTWVYCRFSPEKIDWNTPILAASMLVVIIVLLGICCGCVVADKYEEM